MFDVVTVTRALAYQITITGANFTKFTDGDDFEEEDIGRVDDIGIIGTLPCFYSL